MANMQFRDYSCTRCPVDRCRGTPRYYVTVSEAIALAAGPNRYASTGNMVIVRGARRIPIDYDAILSGKSPEQDVVVMAGDAVRVP